MALRRRVQRKGLRLSGIGQRGRLAAQLQASGIDPDRIATVAVDLTTTQAPQQIIEAALSRWGRVDYLINNAGIGSPKPLHETDDETLDHFLNLMLRAPFRLARDVLAHLAVTGSIAAGDSLVQQLVGHGLAARLSAKLGEGVVNGMMTVRIGIAAMETARPLPFNAVKRPGVSDFLSALTTFATRKANDGN